MISKKIFCSKLIKPAGTNYSLLKNYTVQKQNSVYLIPTVDPLPEYTRKYLEKVITNPNYGQS